MKHRKNSTSSNGSVSNQISNGSTSLMNQIFDEGRSPSHCSLSPSPLREHGLTKNSLTNMKGKLLNFY